MSDIPKIGEYLLSGLTTGAVMAALLRAWLGTVFKHLDERHTNTQAAITDLRENDNDLFQRTGKLEREQNGLVATFATKRELERTEERLQREIDRNDNR